MPQGPLSGYRVIDLSQVLSGPAATMMLADQGADVIKIEPFDGDITRAMGVGENGMTAFHLNINRGKRAMSVDLKSPKALEIIRQLIRTADVLVQNFRPGVIEKLGLGYEAVKAINGDIVYVSISGFGPKGPYSNKRVYDPVIQALSGITDIQVDVGEDRPRMMRTIIPDKTTALTAAQAITAALLSRERTAPEERKAQHVELAMLDATIAYLWPEAMMKLTVCGDEDTMGIGQVTQDLVFKTTDGYITVGVMNNAQWVGLCKALEREDWLEDERFNTPAKRFENARERLAATEAELATRSSAEWLEILDQNGVPSAPILSRVEVLSHEQVIANELIHEYEHPEMGRVRQPRPAAKFEHAEPEVNPLAPRLGEHNREILTELGYDDAAIEELLQAKVIGALQP
jgi:crotonobetainyl-CoA:carnitine CoA-transferase CaiB-like acyl-CoA transferase